MLLDIIPSMQHFYRNLISVSSKKIAFLQLDSCLKHKRNAMKSTSSLSSVDKRTRARWWLPLVSVRKNVFWKLGKSLWRNMCLPSLPSGSTRSTRSCRGFGSTSTSCWALSCFTSSRGRSTPRSWLNTRTCPCRRCTERHTCCVSLVGREGTHTHTHTHTLFHHQRTDKPL